MPSSFSLSPGDEKDVVMLPGQYAVSVGATPGFNVELGPNCNGTIHGGDLTCHISLQSQ